MPRRPTAEVTVRMFQALDPDQKRLALAEMPHSQFTAPVWWLTLDEVALASAYYRQRADAAVGVDGVTKEQYGQDLVQNIRDLHQRLRTKRYRHQPIRRVHIPKDHGKTRPLGISAFEDNIVQDRSGLYRVKAVTEIADFNEKFGTTFSDEEFDTIGGIVLQRFGRVPRRGEEVVMDGYTFKVLRADSRRVYLLEVTPKATISA